MNTSDLSHEELIALDEEKKRESEKKMREFLERHDSVKRSEMYRILVDGGNVPHWCFYEILEEMKENGEIIKAPIWEVVDYKIKKGE